jgi:hypothetical protein
MAGRGYLPATTTTTCGARKGHAVSADSTAITMSTLVLLLCYTVSVGPGARAGLKRD